MTSEKYDAGLHPISSFRRYSPVNTMSCAVSAAPLDHLMPSLSFQVMLRRSEATPPFSHRGDLFDEHRRHVAVLVVMGERLEHQGRRLDVLGAAGEIGIDGRRRLPVQDVEAAVAATLGVGSGRHHRRHHRLRSQAGLVDHFLSAHLQVWLSNRTGEPSFEPLPFRALMLLRLAPRSDRRPHGRGEARAPSAPAPPSGSGR